ncbi:DUF4181 domain-containing protein [Bacillus sp. FSL H8-0547]
MLKFLLFIMLVLLYITFSEKLIRRKLGIPKQRGFFYHSTNRIQRWTEGTLIVLYAAGLMIFEFSPLFITVWVSFFLGVRTFMEWKFEREEREYILSLHAAATFPLVIAAGYWINSI